MGDAANAGLGKTLFDITYHYQAVIKLRDAVIVTRGTHLTFTLTLMGLIKIYTEILHILQRFRYRLIIQKNAAK